MFGLRKIPVVFVATLVISSLSHADNSKYGVTVSRCYYDYDKVDFCTDSKMKAYAKVLKNRKPNFDTNHILYIFEEDKSLMDEPDSYTDKYYRMVAINPKDKTVVPATFGITEARDYDGTPVAVNEKGELLEFDFNVNSNKFCFKGNMNAYRRGGSYNDEPQCFNYEKEPTERYKSFRRIVERF